MEQNEMMKKEVEDVNVRIENRGGNIFFAFDAKSVEGARLWHDAIVKVLNREGRSPTPHAPYAEGKGDQPGYQNQEVGSIGEEEAERLLGEIKSEVYKL